MDDWRKRPAMDVLWTKVFQVVSRRDVVIASVVGLCGLGLFLGARRSLALTPYEKQLLEEFDESEYIKMHTSFVEVDSQRLRVFYAEHSLVTKLPKPTPLIVFIAGLGGQIDQFEPILQYFGQVADVLALDLPGCGQSPMTDRRWDLYTTESLSQLIQHVIEGKVAGRKTVIIGHSLGTMIAGRLALRLGDQCLAVVLLCPKAEISEKERRGIALMTRLPESVFNFFRKRDRAGGIHSPSVTRMLGPNVSDRIKTRQLVWNLQSQTPTTLRMLKGANPLTREEWGRVIPPVLIIAGELDKVCPPTDAEKIQAWLPEEKTPDIFIVPFTGHAIMIESPEIVCDVINDFLVKMDPHLSHAWQLSYTAGEKWSLKNEQKWMNVQSVSDLIGRSPLRAMKTLRQTDQAHSPFHLIRQYPNIRHVIDISHGVDAAYDPASFHNTPVTYHKFPTAAKIPPTEEDVKGFVAVVKECLATSKAEGVDSAEIVVHCHYGFNRSGFVICCWLIEEEEYGVKEALEAFRTARPNGIRHMHFISTLHRRYPDRS